MAPFECLRSHDGSKPLSRNLNIDLVEYLFRRVAEVDQDELLLKISLTTPSRDPAVAVLPPQQLQAGDHGIWLAHTVGISGQSIMDLAANLSAATHVPAIAAGYSRSEIP